MYIHHAHAGVLKSPLTYRVHILGNHDKVSPHERPKPSESSQQETYHVYVIIYHNVCIIVRELDLPAGMLIKVLYRFLYNHISGCDNNQGALIFNPLMS